jgi:hypothetical protein
MPEALESEFFAWLSVRSTVATRTIFRDLGIDREKHEQKWYFAAAA